MLTDWLAANEKLVARFLMALALVACVPLMKASRRVTICSLVAVQIACALLSALLATLAILGRVPEAGHVFFRSSAPLKAAVFNAVVCYLSLRWVRRASRPTDAK